MNNNTLERMIAILTKQTGNDASGVTGDTQLDTLGIDSFDFIEFLFLVEDEFNVTIEAQFNDFGTRLKTVNDIVEAVDALVRDKQSSRTTSPAEVSAPLVSA